MDTGVLRALALQLDQDRLGDEILLGGHQRLNHVGARRPMARIELQGLKIKLDRPLVLPAPQVQVAEAAPAIRQVRRDRQCRLIIDACELEIAAGCGDVAEPRVQFGQCLGGFGAGLLGLEQDRAGTPRWRPRPFPHGTTPDRGAVAAGRSSRWCPYPGKRLASAECLHRCRSCPKTADRPEFSRKKPAFELCQFLVNRFLPAPNRTRGATACGRPFRTPRRDYCR